MPPIGDTFIEPVLTYAHRRGCRTRRTGRDEHRRQGHLRLGGYIYRGSAIPELEGHYVFGDWSQSFQEPGGKFFVAQVNDGAQWEFVLTVSWTSSSSPSAARRR